LIHTEHGLASSQPSKNWGAGQESLHTVPEQFTSEATQPNSGTLTHVQPEHFAASPSCPSLVVVVCVVLVEQSQGSPSGVVVVAPELQLGFSGGGSVWQ
jgi:hypothetical protein